MKTGERMAMVRYGFTDSYDFQGNGYIACAYGNLDAPDIMPQGSHIGHINGMTGKPGRGYPSQAHRDYPNHPIGSVHNL